jgi:hypothetical protein
MHRLNQLRVVLVEMHISLNYALVRYDGLCVCGAVTFGTLTRFESRPSHSLAKQLFRAIFLSTASKYKVSHVETEYNSSWITTFHLVQRYETCDAESDLTSHAE